MKKIFFILVLAALLFPHSSHAQVDARCWYKNDCIDARKEFKSNATPDELKEGFIQNVVSNDLCKGVYQTEDNPIGFCLPSTNAKIKIAIGGQTEFTGLAEFIAFIYQYGMGLAGILSVLVLIFAGVQWIISGGNAETISKAKHKIVGAVIGMVILAAAYTILYTVNPDLVNLRPPNAWMINTLNLPTNPSCQAMTKGEKISPTPAYKTGEKLNQEDIKKKFSSISTWVAPTTTQTNIAPPNAPPAHCGQSYFVQGTGALTCTGDYCPKDAAGNTQVCFNKDGLGEKCEKANILGEIHTTGLWDQFSEGLHSASFGLSSFTGAEGWTFPWVKGDEGAVAGLFGRAPIFLYAICNDGNNKRVNGDGLPIDPELSINQKVDGLTKKQLYGYIVSDEGLTNSSNSCDSEGGLKGFLLGVCHSELGDQYCERHFIGKTLAPNGVENTSGTYTSFDISDVQSEGDTKCVLKNTQKSHFFQKEEVQKGFKLNIDVSKTADIDNSDDWKKAYANPSGIHQYGVGCPS